jgi:hypothetical protein
VCGFYRIREAATLQALHPCGHAGEIDTGRAIILLLHADTLDREVNYYVLV